MLPDHERRFLLTRRVGHLATADSRAIPHVVPVCFTISQDTLYITIDEKPKRVAGPALKPRDAILPMLDESAALVTAL